MKNMFQSIIEKDTGDYAVVKSNQLVQQSKINLSIYEQRTINFLISKILADDTAFEFIEFDYNDFCRLCGIKSTNRSYIKKVIKTLCDKSWWLTGGEKDILIRWIGEAELTSDTIRLKFHPQMEQFLLNLKERGGYTQTELLTYLNFKNKYSPILYDYCRSYLNLTFKNKMHAIERTLTIDELRGKLGLNEPENQHKYHYFKDLRTYVLEPAIAEINDYADIHIEYEPIKKSRRVDKIRLIIEVRDLQERLKLYAERKGRIHYEND